MKHTLLAYRFWFSPREYEDCYNLTELDSLMKTYERFIISIIYEKKD